MPKTSQISDENKAVNAIDAMVYNFEMGYDTVNNTVNGLALFRMSKILLDVPVMLRAVTYTAFINVLREKGYPLDPSYFLENS